MQPDLCSSLISPRTILRPEFFALLSSLIAIHSLGQVLLHEPDYPWALYYPNPYMLWMFILGQQILGLTWLVLHFYPKPDRDRPDTPLLFSTGMEDVSPSYSEDNSDSLELHKFSEWSYLPFFILGNAWISIWCTTWLDGKLILSQIVLSFNTLTHIFAIYVLRTYPISHDIFLTNLTAKTSTGISIILAWKNWGSFDTAVPIFAQILQCGLICMLFTVCTGPDPTLGICLVYGLITLSTGPGSSEEWRLAFKYIAIVIMATVLIDQFTAVGREKSWIIFAYEKWRARSGRVDGNSYVYEEEEEVPMLPLSSSPFTSPY